MKTIRNWNDLRPFGIEILTGEACAYGMRYLCELNAKGAAIVREFLGLRSDKCFGESWNSRSNGEPSVGSIMLPYDVLAQLATFCLFDDGAVAVVVARDVSGFAIQDDVGERQKYIDDCHHFGTLVRTYSPLGGPRKGSRMIHAMTGDSE